MQIMSNLASLKHACKMFFFPLHSECDVTEIAWELFCHSAPQEKQLACKRYGELQEELSGMKGRNEREIQSLKEHLKLAMAALQEGQKLGNSLDHWENTSGTKALSDIVTSADWYGTDVFSFVCCLGERKDGYCFCWTVPAVWRLW